MAPKLATMLSVMAPAYGLILFSLAVTPLLTAADIVFGVRIPKEHAADATVFAVRRDYWTRLFGVALVGAGLGFLAYDTGGLAAGLGAMLLATLAAGFVNVALAHGAMEDLKQSYGASAEMKETSVASLTEPSPHPGLGVPALLALALVAATIVTALLRYPHLPTRIPVHFGLSGAPNRFALKTPGTFVALLLPTTLVVLLMLVLSRLVLRTPRDLDPVRPTGSEEEQSVFTRRNHLLLEWAAWLVALEGLLGGLLSWGVFQVHGPWLMAATLFPILVLVVAVFVVAFRTGQLGSRLHRAGSPTEAPRPVIHRDDDRYWRAGVIYVNPDDPNWFVPKRFGYGYTINLGHRGSYIAIAILAVLVAAGPILSAIARH